MQGGVNNNNTLSRTPVQPGTPQATLQRPSEKAAQTPLSGLPPNTPIAPPVNQADLHIKTLPKPTSNTPGFAVVSSALASLANNRADELGPSTNRSIHIHILTGLIAHFEKDHPTEEAYIRSLKGSLELLVDHPKGPSLKDIDDKLQNMKPGDFIYVSGYPSDRHAVGLCFTRKEGQLSCVEINQGRAAISEMGEEQTTYSRRSMTESQAKGMTWQGFFEIKPTNLPSLGSESQAVGNCESIVLKGLKFAWASVQPGFSTNTLLSSEADNKSGIELIPQILINREGTSPAERAILNEYLDESTLGVSHILKENDGRVLNVLGKPNPSSATEILAAIKSKTDQHTKAVKESGHQVGVQSMMIEDFHAMICIELATELQDPQVYQDVLLGLLTKPEYQEFSRNALHALSDLDLDNLTSIINANPTLINTVVAGLNANDDLQRDFASRVLGRLASSLNDFNPTVADSLRNTPGLVEGLANALSSSTPSTQRRAAIAIANLSGDSELNKTLKSNPFLMQSLMGNITSDHPEVQKAGLTALHSLRGSGDAAFLKEISKALESPDQETQQLALKTIMNTPFPEDFNPGSTHADALMTRMGQFLQPGGDKETSVLALKTLHNLALRPGFKPALAHHAPLLETLTSMATAEDTTNKEAAVTILKNVGNTREMGDKKGLIPMFTSLLRSANPKGQLHAAEFFKDYLKLASEPDKETLVKDHDFLDGLANSLTNGDAYTKGSLAFVVDSFLPKNKEALRSHAGFINALESAVVSTPEKPNLGIVWDDLKPPPPAPAPSPSTPSNTVVPSPPPSPVVEPTPTAPQESTVKQPAEEPPPRRTLRRSKESPPQATTPPGTENTTNTPVSNNTTTPSTATLRRPLRSPLNALANSRGDAPTPPAPTPSAVQRRPLQRSNKPPTTTSNTAPATPGQFNRMPRATTSWPGDFSPPPASSNQPGSLVQKANLKENTPKPPATSTDVANLIGKIKLAVYLHEKAGLIIADHRVQFSTEQKRELIEAAKESDPSGIFRMTVEQDPVFLAKLMS